MHCKTVATRSSHEKAVRLSVKRVDCDKMKKSYAKHGCPQAWARGGRALAPSRNITCFCALLVTAKRSVDELFMHYFHKLSCMGYCGPTPRLPLRLHPGTPLGDFRPKSNFPTLGKSPCGGHAVQIFTPPLPSGRTACCPALRP